MALRVLDAEFLTTATEKKGYPQPDRPEVAFVGRSNVGKSSMINALTNRKKLVRVSNTPGRTRTINFFDVTMEAGETRYAFRFADLPGYGYAQASKGDRKSWQAMIDTYLHDRPTLFVIVVIVDAEVGPTESDFNTIDYLLNMMESQNKKRRLLCVATKMDRLPKAKRKPRIFELAKQLELPPESVLGFSSVEAIGRDETLDSIWSVLSKA